jgi:hypothetical protein
VIGTDLLNISAVCEIALSIVWYGRDWCTFFFSVLTMSVEACEEGGKYCLPKILRES